MSQAWRRGVYNSRPRLSDQTLALRIGTTGAGLPPLIAAAIVPATDAAACFAGLAARCR